MNMSSLSFLPTISLAQTLGWRDNLSKQKVLHHGTFPQDFTTKHFPESLTDFGPGSHARDVVEHGTMPS
jgi:hypothetical protein